MVPASVSASFSSSSSSSASYASASAVPPHDDAGAASPVLLPPSAGARAPRAVRPLAGRQHTFPRASPQSSISGAPGQSFSALLDGPDGAEPGAPEPAPRARIDSDGSTLRAGKRKATDAALDITPPKHDLDASVSSAGTFAPAAHSTPPPPARADGERRGSVRATRFAPHDSRGVTLADAGRAPSGYASYRKRPRVSEPSSGSGSGSAPGTPGTPGTLGSYFTAPGAPGGAPETPPPPPPRDSPPSRHGTPRPPSRAYSARSAGAPASPTTTTAGERARPRSVSQLSIPVSAIVAPHAPSISLGSARGAGGSAYHMRDPRRSHVRPTPWTLRVGRAAQGGSPAHAWAFFAGFVLFPLWWAFALWRVPRTRSVGEAEKAVVVDDPQIEHDARTWRTRCRIMALIACFTYVPFVALVSYFATR